LPPGAYRIFVGLADAESGDWVPVLDESGRIVETTASVLPVEIGPAAAPLQPEDLHLAHSTGTSWVGAGGFSVVRLLGHSSPGRAEAGQKVVIEAGWLGEASGPQDLQTQLRLIAPDGKVEAQERLPLSGHPTSRWRAGEVIHELYDLHLPAALSSETYTLTLAVLDEDGAPLASSLTGGAGEQSLGKLRISVQERSFELPQAPQQRTDLRLGQEISLLGYDLSTDGGTLAKGEQVRLTLYWRSEGAPATSYTVFVHLLDEQSQVRGQQDQIPGRGRAPTSGWVEGQVVVDEYAVPLDVDAPPGIYRIEVGMYNARDLVRLPVTDASGARLPGDRYLLAQEVRVANED
jgi:hypothetical protein